MANTPTVNPSTDLTTGVLPTTAKATGGTAGGLPNNKEDLEQYIWINEINHYEFMRHADNGTGGFLFGQYLTNHTRERNFKERRNYSYYLNFVRRIINALTKPIFREEPVREEQTNNAFFSDFLEDCDRRGSDFNKFMKKVARKTKRYGVYFVVVENDKAENIAGSVADAKAKKQYPYVYCYSPENVVEYEWDQLHRIKRIVFREWKENKDGKKVWQFREWTKDAWVLFEWEDDNGKVEKKKKIIDQGAVTIGEIPVIAVYDEEPDEDEDPVLAHPPLYHIARTNLAVYDVCSELRELERNQGFSLMRIPVEPGKGIPMLEVGTKNAIPFPKDASQPPDFMSPDAAIPTAIMADRKFLIEQMFEMAALVGIIGVVLKNESGRAKEWEFQSAREELTRFGHVMEDTEEAIARLFGKYINAELDYEVNYSENYGLVDMTAETEAASMALGLNISTEVNTAIKKDWVLKNFRDSAQEVVDALLKSVDDAAENEAFSNAGAADKGVPGATGTPGDPAPGAPAPKLPTPQQGAGENTGAIGQQTAEGNSAA